MSIEVTTNHVPRDVVDAWELSAEERAEFDYLDWTAIEEGSDSASFFRYKGTTYDLNDMERGFGNSPMPRELEGWDNYISDSFFSGIVIRYCEDNERVIVGRYYVASDAE